MSEVLLVLIEWDNGIRLIKCQLIFVNNLESTIYETEN